MLARSSRPARKTATFDGSVVSGIYWTHVTNQQLFPFHATILPRSFRGLLKLAEEERAAEMSTKST